MTKADLIEEVSRLAEVTRKDSEVIVETIFDSVVRALRAGDKIEIRGFGSFRTRQRKARVGRNPKTGDRVEVPPKKIPFFIPRCSLRVENATHGSRFCCKEVFVRDTRSSVFLDSSHCQHPARNVLFPMREEDVGVTRGALIQSLDILFGNPSVHRLTNVCFNK